jgi:glyoxylase-like metal-dependent hydrolase (beta-lactamase superfamily II)
MHRVQLGRASVTRVVQFQFDLSTRSFPHTPQPAWHDNADLLAPDFFRSAADKWHIAVQSWVIEVDGLTALASTGVDRNAVDVVINTHIHSDHVGWNTILGDDTSLPTFPNARYFAPAADYQHFASDGPGATIRTSADHFEVDQLLEVEAL